MNANDTVHWEILRQSRHLKLCKSWNIYHINQLVQDVFHQQYNSVPSVFKRFLKSSWKNKEDPLLKALFHLCFPEVPVLRLSRGRALGHKGSFALRWYDLPQPRFGWVLFIHLELGILELISKNALEPVWNLPFFGDCVSPPKTRSGFPINTWVIWVPGTPMDSHHQPPFWFLCNPAAPARGQNGWWFASWVPSGNVWSRQWNSRHSSRFWTRRMRARRDDSEILHQAVEGRTNKKWWDHLPTSTGLQDFGQRYLKPSQTSSPRMTGWRKFQLDLHESSKDMSRFPGSMQKSQWPYVKQNKFPKGLWRRSGKGFTASAEADS